MIHDMTNLAAFVYKEDLLQYNLSACSNNCLKYYTVCDDVIPVHIEDDAYIDIYEPLFGSIKESRQHDAFIASYFCVFPETSASLNLAGYSSSDLLSEYITQLKQGKSWNDYMFLLLKRHIATQGIGLVLDQAVGE